MDLKKSIESPLPKLVVNKPKEDTKVTDSGPLQPLSFEEAEEVDEILGVVIDDEMQDKATLIQRRFRQKKKNQKESNRYGNEEEEDVEAIVSTDPNERKLQEEKASYIQSVFRKKKNK